MVIPVFYWYACFDLCEQSNATLITNRCRYNFYGHRALPIQAPNFIYKSCFKLAVKDIGYKVKL